MERKQTIDGVEYTFKFTNRAFIDLDTVYGNASEIYNGVLTGEKHVTNSAKLVGVSCTSPEVDYKYLLDNCTASEFVELGSLANNLVLDYVGVEKGDSNNSTGKESKKK